MVDESQEKFLLNPKELTETLIKARGIHEGLWIIFMEFKLVGSNTGPSDTDLYPTAIVPVVGIGLQRVPEGTPMAVDAAKVNPTVMTEQAPTTI
jgi:hypothetical protein